MSLNKFFDVDTGYNVCKFDIGALEMKCNDLETQSINNDVWNNGNLESVVYGPYIPISTSNGNVITNTSTLITFSGGSKKSAIITGNIILNNVNAPYVNNSTNINIVLDMPNDLNIKYPAASGGNYPCATATATLRNITTPTTTDTFNMGTFISYFTSSPIPTLNINCIRQNLNISSINPERELYINYTLNLPLNE